MLKLLDEVENIKNLFKGSKRPSDAIGIPPSTKDALKIKDIKALYRRPELISDVLDFHKYDAKHQCFISSDTVTHGIVFDVGIIPALGRSDDFIATKRDRVSSANKRIPQHADNPYVVQTFSNEEPLDNFINEVESYHAERGVDDAYRREYMAMWGDHFRNISREGGYFKDETLGTRWGGNIRRVRYCVYRDMSNYDSGMYESPKEEISQVVAQVVNSLRSAGAAVRIYDPSDVYNWLVPWFNPFPDGLESGVELVQKYPLPYEKGSDFVGLNELLFKATPYFNVKDKCVVYNEKQYSTIVSVSKFTSNPKMAAFTESSVEGGDRCASALETLPHGCIVATTTIIKSQHDVEEFLNIVNEDSKSEDERSQEARKTISKAKLAIDENNCLFPSSAYIYCVGRSLSHLKRNRSRVMSVLRNINADPIELNADTVALDCYIKFLPFSFKPEYDKDLYRTKLYWDLHIANLFPVYGYSTGSGNHCFMFFNMEGNPFTFDPFNSDDKEQNSNLAVIAPPGTGKSATVNQLISSTKAAYNPYFVVIDVNGSFKLHEQYFKELGFTTHYADVAPDSDVSFPLFSDAVPSYLFELKRAGKKATVIDLDVGDSEGGPASLTEEEEESSDRLEQLTLTARTMITKGEEEAEKQFQATDHVMLKKAILAAGKDVHDAGRKICKTEDVVAVLWRIAENGKYNENDMREIRVDRRHRAEDFAEALEDFTTGVKGHLFNREAETAWPEVDLLVLDLNMIAQEGYKDILYLTFMGLMNNIVELSQARRGQPRQTVCINDEAHVVNMARSLAKHKRTSIKMGRKNGLWIWDSTQNIKDYPKEALDILNSMEWLIVLKLPKAEINRLKEIREVSDEEVMMIENLTTKKGKFVEGVVLSNKIRGAFRSIPPAWYLALGQTEAVEYGERLRIMEEQGVTEIGAAHVLERQIEESRCDF